MNISSVVAICFGITLIASSCNQVPGKHEIKDSSTNWALINFVKVDSINPVLIPGTNQFKDPISKKLIAWEAKDVFNPAIVVRENKIFMLYRAQDKVGLPDGCSRIGLATSTDGFHFTKTAQPVFYPDIDSLKKYEWPGGAEDPRIVEDEQGEYYMTYTAFDGTLARLLVASSTDLIHWKKHGSVFAKAYQGKYKNLWSKSGSIVSTYRDGKIIATQINGKYWMYWGDQNIWAATSTDLINWQPVEMSVEEKAPIPLKGQALNMPQLKIVVPTRNKKFDSDLVESGPPAMLTDKGILLIYNSRNLKDIGDTSLPNGTYTAGEVLLDKNDPTKIIKRLEHYFMKPDKPYELSGQVNNVCFLEGLANFKGKWFLYYGTADSKIAVAVSSK
ncbi:MAG: glycoside hydrolase family 130 protein [Chitinophagaceae bacterium]|nr:glycoside hydrolase family 130 protein [Chitinophagaceae bacterium]